MDLREIVLGHRAKSYLEPRLFTGKLEAHKNPVFQKRENMFLRKEWHFAEVIREGCGKESRWNVATVLFERGVFDEEVSIKSTGEFVPGRLIFYS